MPDVLAHGRWHSGDELDAMARRWRGAVRETLGDGDRPIAAVLPATPDGVALFVALTSLPSPLILLVPDVRTWRTEPAIPVGTGLVLPPSLAHLGPEARRLGFDPLALPDAAGSRENGAAIIPFQGPGVVLFTSGSTGAPKPVFRPMRAILAGVTARFSAFGLGTGAGILTGVSLAHGQGLTYLLSAILLQGPLGLLDPLDHRTALEALALPVFQCWGATPHFADVLGRCDFAGPATAPRVCVLSSPISRGVFDAFHERFGVPLRQAYSSTETGPLTADNAPPSAVRPAGVGHPLPGVEIRVGDHPTASSSRGETGRLWVRNPWQMAGYGFPPEVERPGDVDGWWPTRDLGVLEGDRSLTLVGRLDDCVRTREGRLVNLAMIATHLRGIPGVIDAAVVPLDGPAGVSFGAVVECEPGVAVATLRARLADTLALSSWPRTLELVRSLPRLPNGKPDRRTCVALLRGTPAW